MFRIDTASGGSAGDGDRAELTPVIGLAAVGRAAVAEEAARVGIGIEVQSLDLSDSLGDESVNDISLEVEVRLAPGCDGEEALVVALMLEECLAKRLVDLVRRLADARADRRVDVVAAGAEPLHRRDRRIGHAGERSAPPGMRSADDDSTMIREEHRRAIRGEDAEQEVRAIGDHGVGARTRILSPWRIGVNDLSRMDLVDGRKLRVRQERGDRAAAVLVDRGALVIAAVADVEAGQLAARHAAAPPEEAVRELAERDSADHVHGAHACACMMTCRRMRSSSAWVPTMKS